MKNHQHEHIVDVSTGQRAKEEEKFSFPQIPNQTTTSEQETPSACGDNMRHVSHPHNQSHLCQYEYQPAQQLHNNQHYHHLQQQQQQQQQQAQSMVGRDTLHHQHQLTSYPSMLQSSMSLHSQQSLDDSNTNASGGSGGGLATPNATAFFGSSQTYGNYYPQMYQMVPPYYYVHTQMPVTDGPFDHQVNQGGSLPGTPSGGIHMPGILGMPGPGAHAVVSGTQGPAQGVISCSPSASTSSSPSHSERSPVNQAENDPQFVHNMPLQREKNGKYLCTQCLKTYSHAKHLRRHLLKHFGIRPYSCDVCGKAFYRADIRKRHVARCQKNNGNRSTMDSSSASVSNSNGASPGTGTAAPAAQGMTLTFSSTPSLPTTTGAIGPLAMTSSTNAPLLQPPSHSDSSNNTNNCIYYQPYLLTEGYPSSSYAPSVLAPTATPSTYPSAPPAYSYASTAATSVSYNHHHASHLQSIQSTSNNSSLSYSQPLIRSVVKREESPPYYQTENRSASPSFQNGVLPRPLPQRHHSHTPMVEDDATQAAPFYQPTSPSQYRINGPATPPTPPFGVQAHNTPSMPLPLPTSAPPAGPAASMQQNQ